LRLRSENHHVHFVERSRDRRYPLESDMNERLTSEEAAKYLGYSYFHFMREIKTQQGFPVPSRTRTPKGFGHAKYDKRDLDTWFNNNKRIAA